MLEASAINKGRAMRIASLLVGIGVLAGFIYFVGVGSLTRVLLQVNPILIMVMVAVQLLGFTFYATAWYLLIHAVGHRLRFLTCVGITLASIFASYTMPSGVFLEVVRCLLGAKEANMKLGESTATVILHRILYIIGFLGSTVLALAALLFIEPIRATVIDELVVLPVIAVAGLLALLYMSFDPKRIQPVLDRVLKFSQPLIRLVQKKARVEGKAGQFLNEYHLGFRKMLASRGHMLASFVASLGDWTCSVLILWIVLFALRFNPSIWVVMITIAIGKMIQMTPIAVPGMLGIYETAVTASLSMFAVPVAVAASAAILSRIVTFWLDLPIAGMAAYHYGYKVLGQRAFSLGSQSAS